jgi:hypothetical protein
MDDAEKELREEYFDGPMSDQFSFAEFLIMRGRGDLARKEQENFPKGMKNGGYVHDNKKPSKKARGGRKATKGLTFRGVR